MARLDTDALAYDLRLYADENQRLREGLDALGRHVAEMVAMARQVWSEDGDPDPPAVFRLTIETFSLDCILQHARLARSAPPDPCDFRDICISRSWEALQRLNEITR